MLVLSRNEGQRIRIDNRITIIVTRIRGNRVSIGIEAPADVSIHRDEVLSLQGPPVAEQTHTCEVAGHLSCGRGD